MLACLNYVRCLECLRVCFTAGGNATSEQEVESLQVQLKVGGLECLPAYTTMETNNLRWP